MDLKETLAIGGITELKKMQESGLVEEIEMYFSDLPSIDALKLLPKKTDILLFFEALVKQTSLYSIKAHKKLLIFTG